MTSDTPANKGKPIGGPVAREGHASPQCTAIQISHCEQQAQRQTNIERPQDRIQKFTLEKMSGFIDMPRLDQAQQEKCQDNDCQHQIILDAETEETTQCNQ